MNEMLELVLEEARERMSKAVGHARHEFSTVRTGRASSALVEGLIVDYYGSEVQLKQLANFSVPEPRLLAINPFDKASLGAIEKAIRNSDLGLNPSNDGVVIRLAFPQLTEERRRDLVKVARHITEEGRVSIRNVRRDVMHDLRELKSEGDVGADDEKRAESELQKLTDERIAELDGFLKAKEAEILEV
jgi:ribosome recycling factor